MGYNILALFSDLSNCLNLCGNQYDHKFIVVPAFVTCSKVVKVH